MLNDFLSAKTQHRKLSMVTCYDYTFARLLSKTPIDAILVGDSARNNGSPSGVKCRHCRGVPHDDTLRNERS